MTELNIKSTELPNEERQKLLGSVIADIKNILEKSRSKVVAEVNRELLATYWKIGEIIVKYEQNDQIRAAYGEKILLQLSKTLTKEFGKGFSRSNLQNMRLLYLRYPICQSLTGKLTWTHYCELLSISDEAKRSFYEKECANAGWSVRELKRQIESSLFERLLLSQGSANKEQVLELAAKGVDYSKPEAVGQINMYLNYYATEVNDLDDNPPIGIILCTDKDDVAAEYALGGLSNQVFASRYVLHMPDKDQLIEQVEDVLKKWHDKNEESETTEKILDATF